MTNTIEILKKHTKANIYKTLCIFAEDAMNLKNGAKVFDKWIKLESFEEPKTNFKGILYKNENEHVICYLGTERSSVKDHVENIVMGVFGKSMQMRIANYFYSQCKRKYDIFNEDLTLVGHSEGGTEATYTGIRNNVKVVTFNPFGLSQKLVEKDKDYSELITNYRDAADLVSKLKENIGETYIVETTVKQSFVKNFLGSINAHKIANFGDCENAVPLEDYKKSNKMFLDKYKVFTKL